jgi:Na+/H+ antiporter NhaC
MKKEEKKLEFYGSNYMALIPLAVFIGFCISFFVIFKVFDMSALAMGGFVALIVGSLFSKSSVKYWDAVIKGMSSPMINTLVLILLIVGIFVKLMARGGVAEGFVWLGYTLNLNGGLFVVFTFIATCVIASATGTSIGTLFSAFPIFYPSGILLGAEPVVLAGAILSGAIFGDNVAPISDTTIASATSQRYNNKKGFADVGGCVSSRLKFALVGALIASVLFFVNGSSGTLDASGLEILQQYMDPKGLIMLLPVIILLVVATVKRNIFIAITWGIISGTVIGLVSGVIIPSDIISVKDGSLSGFAIDGITNMLGTVGFNYALGGIIGIMTASGTMERIIALLLSSKLAQTDAGTELIIALGVIITAICLGAANSPAIIMFGPIADELGRAKNLHPYRRANLLDGCAATIPVLIPFISAFIFIVMSVTQSLMVDYPFIGTISPIKLALSTYHCIALTFVFLFSIMTGWGRVYEGQNGEPVGKAKEYIAERLLENR